MFWGKTQENRMGNPNVGRKLENVYKGSSSLIMMMMMMMKYDISMSKGGLSFFQTAAPPASKKTAFRS